MRLDKLLQDNTGRITKRRYEKLKQQTPVLSAMLSRDSFKVMGIEIRSKQQAIRYLRNQQLIRRYEEQHGIERLRGFHIMVEDEQGVPPWPEELQPWQGQTDIITAYFCNKFDLDPTGLQS